MGCKRGEKSTKKLRFMTYQKYIRLSKRRLGRGEVRLGWERGERGERGWGLARNGAEKREREREREVRPREEKACSERKTGR